MHYISDIVDFRFKKNTRDKHKVIKNPAILNVYVPKTRAAKHIKVDNIKGEKDKSTIAISVRVQHSFLRDRKVERQSKKTEET